MGPEGIEVRPAKSRDSDQMWPLVQDFAFSYEPERSSFERSLAELLERPDTLLLVAEENGTTIVGYLLASCHGTFLANGQVHGLKK
jgi:hypothetical protein